MLLKQINIHYQEANIITDFELHIQSGEIFVLMGPSGSGKTTLLKGIAGLVPIASGEQCWENGTGTVGMVFQEPRLFPHLTVLENISFGLRVQGVPRKERTVQAGEFLKILQLDGLEDRYPHQLSGGQQQRVSLGRTLILKPDLLLLDEPFASLDTPLRLELIDWLYHFQRENQFSIIWVTHFLDEAFSVADRIGIMIEGSLKQAGRPAELYQQPSSEKIASFLSLPNRLTREQWQKCFQCDLSTLPTKERGWIPANGLQLIDKQLLPEISKEEKLLGFISGIVIKIIPGNDGFSVIVKSDDCLLEINSIEWNSIPELNEEVYIKIPFERIIWYHQ
ncbi:ATP-binding cassette domain-containing protein [Neobacillus sp. PS3-40]|uniref:ABC transporter ATP-binding protein n=1 Tax=Neobacillus sp. PS3-40 TaxID=3070679 RepID=UPI0027E1188B|nr:ATP-binding cassette domain-containing protein [Neobacillus sp. PS3-40]WML43889.1 ATP-binding cassette domain-containing protein [Neobacillus sp. PS3-40]